MLESTLARAFSAAGAGSPQNSASTACELRPEQPSRMAEEGRQAVALRASEVRDAGQSSWQSLMLQEAGVVMQEAGVVNGKPVDAPPRRKSTGSTRSNLTLPPRKGSENSESTPQKSPARRGSFSRNSGSSTHRPVFADAAAMKEKLKTAIGKREYRVSDFYSETGIAQCIARSALFENICLLVIGVNAVWIAIDTDFNKAAILLDAHPVFLLVDSLFCAFFLGEWLIRFLAFEHKRHCLRDRWFIFDSVLVWMMVADTWVMSLVFALVRSGSDGVGSIADAGGVSHFTIFRVIKLLRLVRMARVLRLLRATPELMVMIKAMGIAMRSVFFTLIILMILIYVYAIAFTRMMEGTHVGEEDFSEVMVSINTLLVFGVIPEQEELVEGVGSVHVVYRLVMLTYVALATLTMMHMLVGIMVEVIYVVSSVEKEQLLINFVTEELGRTLSLHGLGTEGDTLISRVDFGDFLEKPYTLKALKDIGVDAVGLVDFADFMFADAEEITFAHFMETILQLRGSNVATVKDIVDLRKFVTMSLNRLELQLDFRRTASANTEAYLHRAGHKHGQSGGGNNKED